MNGYLVDTNIPSELTRPKPKPVVVEFLKQAGKERVYVSALTLGEICKGIGVGSACAPSLISRPRPGIRINAIRRGKHAGAIGAFG